MVAIRSKSLKHLSGLRWHRHVQRQPVRHELPLRQDLDSQVNTLGIVQPTKKMGIRAGHLAKSLVSQGFAPVWSGSAAEAGLVEQIDPGHQYASTAGRLDLAQLWHLLQGAALLVVPDTGIAHLAKLTGTPTVCLFGPGSDGLFGTGEFWRNHRFVPVIESDFPCRDQHTLFGRRIEWVQRCQRSTAQCAAPACMHALDVERVIAACDALLHAAPPGSAPPRLTPHQPA